MGITMLVFVQKPGEEQGMVRPKAPGIGWTPEDFVACFRREQDKLPAGTEITISILIE